MTKAFPRVLWKRRLVLFILIIFILGSLGWFYIQNRKNQIAKTIIEILDESYAGDITYDGISLNYWSGITSPSINFKNLTVIDTSSSHHFKLNASKVGLTLFIEDLLAKKIQIKSIDIQDGNLFLDNYTPLTTQEENGLPPLSKDDDSSLFLNEFQLENETQLNIKNLDLQIRHHIKQKLFKIKVNHLSSDIEFEKTVINSNTQMDVYLETLGFNLQKGNFANGVQAKADFSSVIDLSANQIIVPNFLLTLGEQIFETEAEFDLNDIASFDIKLENKQTEFEQTLSLLTDNIKSKLDIVQIHRPFYTRTHLKGNFFYKNNPLVNIEVKTSENSITFNNDKNLEGVSFSGRFINRLDAAFTESTENLKNFKIEFSEFNGCFKAIDINARNIEYVSSPEIEDNLVAELDASGLAEDLNDITNDQHWSFSNGHFYLNANINAEKLDVSHLLANSSAQLKLVNAQIVNNDNNMVLPVSNLSLTVDDNLAVLKELNISINSKENLSLKADIRNFSALFEDKPQSNAHTNLVIGSENLVWENFIRLFDFLPVNNKKKRPDISLQNFLLDIQQKYDPTVQIDLKKFSYAEYEFSNIRSGFHFNGKNTLKLDNTVLDLYGGQMVLDGSLNLGLKDQIPLEAKLDVNSNIELLNLIIDSKLLKLDGNQFQLNGQLNGDLLRPDSLLDNSNLSLIIDNFNVAYLPVDSNFPVSEFNLEIKNDLADLNKMVLQLGNEDQLNLTGSINQLSSLLFKGKDKKVSSEFYIRSDKVIWEDYLKFFESGSNSSKSRQTSSATIFENPEQKLKATLRTIYEKIDPKVSADIKVFQYKDRQLFHDLSTSISFKSKKTLLLDETSFIHNQITTCRLSAEVDLADLPVTNIDLKLEATGSPEELNDILGIDTFRFNGGSFNLNANLRGHFGNFEEMIARSDLNITIQNTSINHMASSVEVPLRRLDLELQNNTAILKALEIVLNSKNHLFLDGKVGHISDLLIDNLGHDSRTYSAINLSADKIDFDEFLSLFSIKKQKSEVDTTETAVKSTIRDIYDVFRPGFEISIDTFNYNNLEITQLKTGLQFDAEDKIYMEQSRFNFEDGKVELDAHLDLSKPDRVLFSFGFDAKKVDVENMLKTFDYFGIDALKNAKKIEGKVNLDAEIEGEVFDNGEIISDQLEGVISFDLDETLLSGFEPLIATGNKIFRKKRVENVRFKPLKDTLTLRNNRVGIPLMEIQSSAFNLFVLGYLGFEDEPTNIWIGFPLDNLKVRDISHVPNKRGYIASGKKVYVEAKSDEKKGMKYKLHLTPKQFYKEREEMDDYREIIKEQRNEIRRFKRARKKQNKSQD